LKIRTKILDLINNNLGKLFTSIKNSGYKYQIEYILKYFIGDNFYKYYYEKSEKLIKSNQSHNSSQQSNKYDPNSSIMNATSLVEAHENMNDGYENNKKENYFLQSICKHHSLYARAHYSLLQFHQDHGRDQE
jgi:hypothetical protein